jgi:hypothetical protein
LSHRGFARIRGFAAGRPVRKPSGASKPSIESTA